MARVHPNLFILVCISQCAAFFFVFFFSLYSETTSLISMARGDSEPERIRTWKGKRINDLARFVLPPVHFEFLLFTKIAKHLNCFGEGMSVTKLSTSSSFLYGRATKELLIAGKCWNSKLICDKTSLSLCGAKEGHEKEEKNRDVVVKPSGNSLEKRQEMFYFILKI